VLIQVGNFFGKSVIHFFW